MAYLFCFSRSFILYSAHNYNIFFFILIRFTPYLLVSTILHLYWFINRPKSLDQNNKIAQKKRFRLPSNTAHYHARLIVVDIMDGRLEMISKRVIIINVVVYFPPDTFFVVAAADNWKNGTPEVKQTSLFFTNNFNKLPFYLFSLCIGYNSIL